MDITNLESGEYVDIWGKMNTPEAGFDLMVVNDGAGTDPHAISFFGTGSSANVFGFSNERVDELCALGIATTDEAKREEYYNEAQEICVEDSTKLCIASPMKYFVSSTSAQGFAPSAADASDFRDTYLTQKPHLSRGGGGGSAPAPPRISLLSRGLTALRPPFPGTAVNPQSKAPFERECDTMEQYTIRRILQLIPVCGHQYSHLRRYEDDPRRRDLGILGVEATPELPAQLAARWPGPPHIVQYLDWIGGVLRGDFGESIRTAEPILPQILTRFQVTAELTYLAAVIPLFVAIPPGILAAVKRNSMVDRLGLVFALLGVSVPGFALSILFILSPSPWHSVSPPPGL